MLQVVFFVALLAVVPPFFSWTPDDFQRSGKVVAGPEGEQHKQFELRNWAAPTLVDLRKSKFLANENGPSKPDALPKSWPAPDALNQLPEAADTEKYPLSFRGADHGLYVRGGSVVGVQPRELPWRLLKACYDGDAVRIESSGPMIVDGLYAENIEDVFSPRGGGDWCIRNSYGKYVRDDFVENDALQSGEIIDCLVEGVHVLISNRPGRKAAARAIEEKSKNPPHLAIRDTLAWLSPMPYDGDMKLTDREHIVDGKAGGKLFKWSPAGGSVTVENCVFRLDVVSPQGASSMEFPTGTYRNVTLVWLGAGEYPVPLPAGVMLSRDIKVWQKTRDAWLKRHGYATAP